MSEITAEMIERGETDAGLRASGQRRRMASRVQQAREKLTSVGTGYRVFDIELLRLFARSQQNAALGIVLLLLTIGCVAMFFVGLEKVGLWLALVMLAEGMIFSICTRFLKIAEHDLVVAVWRRVFVLSTALQCLVWSLISILLIASTKPGVENLVFFVMLLQAAIIAVIAAAQPLAVLTGLVIITGASTLFSLFNSAQYSAPLIVLTFSAQLCFLVVARRIYHNGLQGMTLQAEKDELIAELEQSKLNSDEARRRAEDANLAKSRFLATMSHELRTPLNAILGFSEVMKSELFGGHHVEAYKDYSTDIHASGQHLLALINEILDLSRVEAGRQELREEAVALAYVVEDCRHLLDMRAKKRDITITESFEANLPRIWADEKAIRQVTLNLLSNAIKFTPPGGAVTIHVGWTASGGQYLLVRDNGPGIPESEIPVVMSSFGRGSLAQKNADEGTGLGLPIVKGLMELHGGTFTLKSKVRMGTDAIIVFPPGRVMAVMPQLDPDAPVPESVKRATRTAA